MLAEVPLDRRPFWDQCYTDVMSTDELLAEALRLTRVDRARVAEGLLSSLEESDDEVATRIGQTPTAIRVKRTRLWISKADDWRRKTMEA